jgi:hypothetical protein
VALQSAGGDGMRAAWMALEGEDPELLATLRAYPTEAGHGAASGVEGDGASQGTLHRVRTGADS